MTWFFHESTILDCILLVGILREKFLLPGSLEEYYYLPLCSRGLCFLRGHCPKRKCEHAARFQSYYPCPVPNDAVFFPDRFYPTSEFKAYYEGLMGLPLSMLGVGVGMNLRTHCNTDDPESETSSQQRSEWSGWPTWSMHHRTRTDVQLEGLPK